jgi:hypothetical protein
MQDVRSKHKTGSTILKERTTPDFLNTPSTTNLEGEQIVDAPGKDDNASMPEQFRRPNPWRKMMLMTDFRVVNFGACVRPSSVKCCVVRLVPSFQRILPSRQYISVVRRWLRRQYQGTYSQLNRSFSSLSHDRSKASSKASSAHSAI